MTLRSPFANAPASQLWVLAVVGASLATWTMHWKDYMVLDRYSVFNWAIWRGATSPFVTMGVPDLIMSLVLIQQMRTIERRMGTNKFAAFSLISAALTAALQFSTIALFPSRKLVFGGPAGVIFANLVQHFHEVPALANFRFFGIPTNEKWIYYITAGALACWQGSSSLLTCGFGTLIGCLYRAKGVGLSQARIPSVVARLATSLLSPILSFSDQTAGPQVPVTPGAAVGGGAQPAGRPAAPGAGGGAALPNNNLFANRAEENELFEEIPEHLLNQHPPSEPNIAALEGMGFSRQRAMQALSETGDSVDLAVAVLIAGADE